MELQLTLPNVLGLGGVLGMIFGVYQFFRTPTDKLEKGQIIAEKELENKATILAQQEAENKRVLLASEVKWEKEANEKKFTEFGRKLDDVMLKSQKDVIKIDQKLEGFIRTQNQRNEETSIHFAKLFTLLEERLPKKPDS